MKHDTPTSVYNQYVARKSEGGYAWLLFFVWPFLAAVSAFRNYRKPWAKNIFWAFCAFYGATLAIGVESEGMDIVGYVSTYQEMHERTMTTEEVINYFKQSGEIDVLRVTISYVLSRFTGSQAALTLTYGLIFGFFLSRNIWFLLNRLEGKIAPMVTLLLICFFLVNPIWNINGFRMWTAAHIFLYGMLPWLIDGNWKKLWVSALSIMVHFSFVLPVGVLIGYIFVGNWMAVYFGFYIVTMFFSELNLETFNAYLEAYAPEILQERTYYYRTEASVENLQDGGGVTYNWYVIWFQRALRWSILGYFVILFIKGRSFFSENKGYASLYSFTLLFYGVANFISLLPSGGRFLTIANLFALATIILFMHNRPRDFLMSKFAYLSIPALILFIVVSVRVGLYSISAASILGNPIVAFFISGENLSLNDVLRMII